MRDLSAEEQEQETMMSILSSAVDPIVQINEKGIIQMELRQCWVSIENSEVEKATVVTACFVTIWSED